MSLVNKKNIIESYSFGYIKVNGKEYNKDLIIYPDKISSNWWRKQGHLLVLEDLMDVIDYKPDKLVIGKGDPGMMDVPGIIITELMKQNIKVISKPTKEAVNIFNQLIEKNEKVVGAFHLTC